MSKQNSKAIVLGATQLVGKPTIEIVLNNDKKSTLTTIFKSNILLDKKIELLSDVYKVSEKQKRTNHIHHAPSRQRSKTRRTDSNHNIIQNYQLPTQVTLVLDSDSEIKNFIVHSISIDKDCNIYYLKRERDITTLNKFIIESLDTNITSDVIRTRISNKTKLTDNTSQETLALYSLIPKHKSGYYKRDEKNCSRVKQNVYTANSQI